MKCTIPEISWHNRDPVLSIDVQPILNNEFYRLASGGTDSHVLLWHLRILETGATSVEPVCDLTRHQRAVNVVRWSPSGQYLASGDDDANIIIWQQKADELSAMVDGETSDKEKWSVLKVLRGHKEDVYDICWSPNSLKLVSGSVDNTSIIWDLAKGTNENILTDHKGFVQGVTWDPEGQYIATLCSDRTCRIFNETGKQVKCRVSKGSLAVPEAHSLHGQIVRYYHDDTLKSFFRRLTFSPDGNLLITPAGCIETGEQNKPLYTTYIYVTNSFSQPAVILPSPNQYTIAVRCCPKLFELHSDGPNPVISLPYRMVFAVATRSSVVLYDTQQMSPFAVISNIHYTRLTDVTWSQDGRILAVSSTDGFCSLVTFEANELGTEYLLKEDSDEENLEQSVCELNLDVSATEDKPEEIKKEKKPSFLKQWTAQKNNSRKDEIKEEITEDKKDILLNIPEVIKISDTDITSTKIQLNKSINSPRSTTSIAAKPIAVRRKPRDQMDITKFLKSPNEPPQKKEKIQDQTTAEAKTLINIRTPKKGIKVKKPPENKSASPPVITSDDSIAQDAWTCNNEKMEMDTTDDKKEIIVIDDSQDMKLILEDTTMILQEENKKSSTDIENKQMELDLDIENNLTPTRNDTKIEMENSDTKQIKKTSSDVIDSKIDDQQAQPAFSRITTISKEISQRKKVPFITLSSPKNKKK